MDNFFRKSCEQQEYLDFLEQLLGLEMIDGEAAIGITKMIIDGRVNELSGDQWKTFEKYVAEPNYIDECQRCAGEIPWCEMIDALDNGGYCNYCVHMMEKDD